MTRDGLSGAQRRLPSDEGRSAAPLERYVRAAPASTAVALAGGVVTAQYVGAGLFGYLTPAVLGVLIGAAAQAGAGGPRTGPVARRVRALGAAYAVLGVAHGLALEGSQELLEVRSLLPVACAVAGAVLWTRPVSPAGRGG